MITSVAKRGYGGRRSSSEQRLLDWHVFVLAAFFAFLIVDNRRRLGARLQAVFIGGPATGFIGTAVQDGTGHASVS